MIWTVLAGAVLLGVISLAAVLAVKEWKRAGALLDDDPEPDEREDGERPC